VLDYPVSVNGRLTRALGRCGRSYKRDRVTGLEQTVRVFIEISRDVIEHSREAHRETFLHEVAHAWGNAVGDHHACHNYRWEARAIALGATPERISKIHIGPDRSKVVAVCEGCGLEIRRNRRLNRNKTWHHSGRSKKTGRRCGGTLRLR
jgi:predicted SprT family Zn-dependent metalloprotease